jgi:hypothetical protein
VIKTILAIVISVTFFGVLFFIIVRNLLKNKLDQLVKEEKERKKSSNLK